MERKSFFNERSPKRMEKMERVEVDNPSGLVETLLSINPSEEVVEINFPIIPQRYVRYSSNSAQASRKCYKHGNYINLKQPRSLKENLRTPIIPEGILRDSLEFLQRKNEENIDVVGYAFRPIQGRDRRKRLVPFVWAFEGARLFNYSENVSWGIDVVPYDNSGRVKSEGAEIICKVPSRTKKHGRYLVRLRHVPVVDNLEKNATIWSLDSNFAEEPLHKSYNMRYTWQNSNEGSDVATFYPHEIAAYFGVVKNYLQKEDRNFVPLDVNPFMIPSKRGADFYNRLCNNVLIYENNSGSERVRKPHIAEKSILLARGIGFLGLNEMMYRDVGRDGKITEYDWSIPEKVA